MRYEVVFQLVWVAGAFMAAILPVSIGSVMIIPLTFRGGVFVLALVYLGLGLAYGLAHPARTQDPPEDRRGDHTSDSA